MEERNEYYIYIWIRKDIDKVFYVGKGHGNRYKDMRMRNKYFHNVVNKVSMDNIEIKKIENNLSEQEAFSKEIYYIDFYTKQGHPLTNMTKGGEGSSDWFDRLSEEEKQKHREISKSFAGKQHTEETKRKMSESMTGLKHNMSEEGHKKLSEFAKSRIPYFKGKHHTDETKEKLRQAHLGSEGANAKKVLVLDVNLNIIDIVRTRTLAFEKYPNIKEWHIRKCVQENSKINNLDEILFIDKHVTFIYEKDYNLLKPQSTIKTITSGEVDVSNGVEYNMDEISILEVQGVQ